MANTKAKETKKPEESKPVAKKTETKPEVKAGSSNSNGKTIAITALATALGCLVIVIAVLLCTGVIKFNSGDDDNGPTTAKQRPNDGGNDNKKTGGNNKGDIIDNPYPEVTVKDATLAEVGDLKFYLPDEFEAGGKNKEGAYTYNLTDDDGWAQVLVYTEKSSLSALKYLEKIGPYLDITDTDYEMNGTTWVQGENANSLAYATKLDGKVYAVYYNVKLDSDATSEAMQMIPKTLYMKKIVQE